MKNLLFTLRYDGTDYHGWQVQENANTVQQTFQDAAERICGVRDNVIGCSRTASMPICIAAICAPNRLFRPRSGRAR